MTIHKSQGKTFDKITVDVGTGAFAHGQIYVALSRCRTLEGIILNNPIKNNDIIVDPRVIEFYKTKSIPKSNKAKPNVPTNKPSIREELLTAVNNGSKVKVLYENFNGEASERVLSNLQITDDFNDFGYDKQHVKAFCHLRNEERSFKIDRIKQIETLK